MAKQILIDLSKDHQGSEFQSFFQRHRKFTAKVLIMSMLMLDVPAVPLASAATVSDTSAWVKVPAKSDPMMQNLNIPADASVKGMWSATIPWSINAIQSILLADGRLLTLGTPFGNAGAQDGRFYDIWNPQDGFGDAAHVKTVVPDPVNSFCSTSGWLLDGRLMVAGGNGNGGKSSGLLTTTTNTSTNNPSTMAGERWYASMVGLPDGRQLILGGTVPYVNPINPTPEVFENGAWRSLFGSSSVPLFASRQIGNQPEANPWYYPRAWVAPNGKLFGITSNIMFSLDPNANNGNGSITNIGTFKTTQDSTGATTPNVGFTSSAVMYAPGKILQVGGNGITDNNPNLSSQNATVIDINGANPVITETNPMTFRRHWSNATVLPDGKVAVTGGTTIGWDPANKVGPAEIWNPNTGAWTVGASSVQTRTYHSSALLLPNGTVFTGGGGAPGAVNNLNAEIYYPPNLFTNINGASQLAVRPVIASVSGLQAAYSGTLGVQMANAQNISRLALIQTGSVTHSFNNTQRYVPINFTQNGNILTAQLPANANLAPPGYYMLFAVDANGVPSTGVMLSVGGLKTPPLGYVPTDLPATANLCSGEYGQCTIPVGRTATIYFGANGAYNNLQGQAGNINCNVATFGDPAFGAIKSCYAVLDPLGLPDIVAPITNPGVAVAYTPNVTLVNAQYSWSFGDGSAVTPYSASPNITHTYVVAGIYQVYLTAKLADGTVVNKNFNQAVATNKTALSPTSSSPIVTENRAGNPARVWVVNPDNDSVSVLNSATNGLVAEINLGVGSSPRSIAIAPDGRIWVANKGLATIAIINPTSLAVEQTIALSSASQPHGLVVAPNGANVFVVLEATGQVVKLDNKGLQLATLNVGANIRHIAVTADSQTLLVSRFITPVLPGESTNIVDTSTKGGEVVVVNSAGNMAVTKTITLKHSDKVDNEVQGAGIPNYLAAPAISPDGATAWVPSKQDNIKRGIARNGQNLNFQNTVRAITSKINLGTLAEDYAKRVDHDNSSLGSTAVYHPSGAYLFVALETSRQVGIVDAIGGRELGKVNVGLAPQGLSLSANGNTLYVQNFMDRSVTVLDLTPITTKGMASANLIANVRSINAEKLPMNVLAGKQLFYDAKDPRLARDSYMSCASCHSDGGHDGRVWDFTGFGEGLRNTIALKGRAGMGHGLLHWSGNFDEVQDFEGQIRNFAGGTGLMTDAQFNTGTRNQPLGDKKAGLSADLDNLAAYVGSLNTFAKSPFKNADGSLNTAAQAGKMVFDNANCASCHGGVNLSNSSLNGGMRNIGSINALSGKRLNVALTGLDIPTLKDVWATSPYLHNGSAPTLDAAVAAHAGNTVAAADIANLVAYLKTIDGLNVSPIRNLPDGVYRITAKHSGRVLDLAGASNVDGAWVVQYSWVGSDNERWKLTNKGNGTFTLSPQHSGKVLGVAGCSLGDGATVQQESPNGSNCQLWRAESLTDGTFRIVNVNSGKVLDVFQVSLNNSAQVYQWTWLGGANQTWAIEPVSANNIALGVYSLISANSAKALDIGGAFTYTGAWAIQYDFVNAPNQKWLISPTPDGYFELTPTHAMNMRLEVGGGWLGNGGYSQQGLASSTAAQRWNAERQPDGSWRFINVNSGKVLDSGIPVANGANVVQWDWWGGANQRWKLNQLAGGIPLLAPNTAVSFEPVTWPGYRIRHANFLAYINPINAASSVVDKQGSTWVARTGLADPNCYSFESIDWPGYYMRHANYTIAMNARDGSNLFDLDATFCARAPLTGQLSANAITLESKNLPGYFIHHKNFQLFLEANDGSAIFPGDATFNELPTLQ